MVKCSRCGEEAYDGELGLYCSRCDRYGKRDRSPERPKKNETVKEKRKRLQEKKKKIEAKLAALNPWRVVTRDSRNSAQQKEQQIECENRKEAEQILQELKLNNWESNGNDEAGWIVKRTSMYIEEIKDNSS